MQTCMDGWVDGWMDAWVMWGWMGDVEMEMHVVR